jgi:hypothetical protein
MYSWLIIIRAGPTQKTSTSSSLCRIHLPRDPIDSLLIIAVRNWASVTFHIYQVGFNYFRIWIANMHLRGLDQFQDQKDHQVCSSKDWTRPSAKIIHHLMNLWTNVLGAQSCRSANAAKFSDFIIHHRGNFYYIWNNWLMQEQKIWFDLPSIPGEITAPFPTVSTETRFHKKEPPPQWFCQSTC